MGGRKRAFPWRMLLLLLILIAAAVIILAFRSGFNPAELFVSTERKASSSLILEQVKDISRLNTVEFIYKTVFPYDLLNPDTDMKKTVQKYRDGGVLSPEEAQALSLYGIAAEAGIEIGGTSFAVVEVRLKAGYDFPEQLPESSIRVNEADNTIWLKLPPISITEVIVEDADSRMYEYPDLNVSPEKWKILSAILSDSVSSEALSRGILDQAETRGRQIIRKFLLGAGFSDVIFSE